MASEPKITVEVCYIAPRIQFLRSLKLAPMSTVLQAIQSSGLLDEVPEIAMDSLKVGIYSKPKQLDAPVRDHDRVEIYRPLQVDPMVARRARANKKG